MTEEEYFKMTEEEYLLRDLELEQHNDTFCKCCRQKKEEYNHEAFCEECFLLT